MARGVKVEWLRLRPPQEKFTNQEFRELYDQHFTDKTIARRLGVGRTSVRERRHKLGLKPNAPSPYDTKVWCRWEGKWLPKELAVLNDRGILCCPDCGFRVCTKPRHLSGKRRWEQLRDTTRV